MDLKNNWLVWALVGVTVLNIGTVVVGKVFLDKVADRVIEKLQKEYSPSPYGPGLDPDKVDPNSLHNQPPIYLELKKKRVSMKTSPEEKPEIHRLVEDADNWRRNWERERGIDLGAF